ncbi:sensor domain-containing diguanylate cyclase [Anaerorhabdus sp.]|uniref:sensor domain-containing diguanylate cyclase n=1 Tax=Anaerorhabdus sp. TaxID=1872524 RepID=UPI002FCAF55A
MDEKFVCDRDAKLKIQENNIRNMLDRMQGGIILCNFSLLTQSSVIEYLNQGWTEITGYTLDQLEEEKNGNPQALILPEDKKFADEQYAAQMACGNTYELMYQITRRNGDIRWVIDKGVVSSLPNGIMQNLSVVTDITSLKQQEEAMKVLAQQDQLTEVNNKNTFNTVAKKILERQSDKLHALLMIDVDDFKDVNDSFGHAIGDSVLENVASHLKESFRSCDVVGRVGGDEFAVLITDIPNECIVIKKAEHVEYVMNEKVVGIPSFTVSIGIAYSKDYNGFDELFVASDKALYSAKKKGKNQFQIASK